jgi:omega-amidase
MARTLKVALCQFAPALGDVQGNVLRMAEAVRRLHAAHGPLDLIVFPELAVTGYDARSDLWALSLEAKEALPVLRAAAQAVASAIAAGLPERDPLRSGVLYDSLSLLGAEGAAETCYRKVHLWQEEHLYFAAGSDFRLTRIGDAVAGLGICWDAAFPEWGRACARAGADVLVVASAWDAASIRYWDALLAARAIENGCYIVACNRAGSDGELAFGGHSQILAPTGDRIAFLDTAAEGTLVAELDLDAIGPLRFADLTGLRDLRPDVYQRNPQRD